MNLIALAVPFFLLSLIIEWVVDRVRDTGYYRGNDAINSLSAGILSESTGYFTKLLQYSIWAWVLANLALFEWQRDWFDASPSGIALWVVAALLWDFCYYWNHRLGHEISLLWAAHSVHHQSEEYNLSTALRQTSSGFLFGWIFYVPLFVLGIPADVLITVAAINLIYQFWVHTRHIGKLGVFDRILVTPSNHRVHHAQNERYIDKNYGGILVLWDRLFGTFAEEDDRDPVIFGVRKPLANWNPLWANCQVYSYLWFDAVRTRRWRDKIGIWFRRTGWRPADVAAAYPKQNSDLNEFEKYDPPISDGRRYYIYAQFAVAIGLSLFITETYAELGGRAVLIPCLMLWVLLYTLGVLNDNRNYAGGFEALRLFVVVPLGLFAMQDLVPLSFNAGIIITVYILGSILWLRKS